MYRNLSIALLVAAFGLVAGRSTALPDSSPTSPVIVKKVALANQTAPHSTTALFTPSQSGLFRVSVYMTQTAVSQGQNGAWIFNLGWTDDAGTETAYPTYPIMSLNTVGVPPAAWGSFDVSPGNVVILEGVAGQPITYSIALTGTDNGGTYSAYITVERLI